MRAAPQDIISNNDTLETTGRAYFGDHLTDERLPATQGHPLYRHIRRLNQIRRAIPALQKAPMSHVGEWGSGMSFVRDYNNGESYCGWGSPSARIRTSASAASATVPTGTPSPATSSQSAAALSPSRYAPTPPVPTPGPDRRGGSLFTLGV